MQEPGADIIISNYEEERNGKAEKLKMRELICTLQMILLRKMRWSEHRIIINEMTNDNENVVRTG